LPGGGGGVRTGAVRRSGLAERCTQQEETEKLSEEDSEQRERQ
jgi:hypothetical protein